jgi:hypothetical protein
MYFIVNYASFHLKHVRKVLPKACGNSTGVKAVVFYESWMLSNTKLQNDQGIINWIGRRSSHALI